MAPANTEHPQPLLYTVDDAIHMLGSSRTSIYRLMSEGALESVRFGRRRLIRAASIHALAETGAA